MKKKLIKENMGRTGHTASTDEKGNKLYSDVHYLETYKVGNFFNDKIIRIAFYCNVFITDKMLRHLILSTIRTK